MTRSLRSVRRFLLVSVMIVFCFLFASIAHAESVKTTGYVKRLSLITSTTQKAGTTVRYKLQIAKAGTVEVYLKDNETKKEVKITSKNCPSAGNVLVEIPGSRIGDERKYTVTVKLLQKKNTIGTAQTLISTMKPKAEISSFSATASFTPSKGEVLLVSYSMPNDAAVDAWVCNSAGTKVAKLASGKNAKAGNNTLVWNGMLVAALPAPSGKYTVYLNCTNAGGISETVKSQFTVIGNNNAVSGTVAGSIRSVVFPVVPKAEESATLYVNNTKNGAYKLALKDLTTKKTISQSGSFTKRIMTIKIPGSALVGGHKYQLVIQEAVSGSLVGKAQINFTAQYPDPPVINTVLMPSELDASFGASMRIDVDVNKACKLSIVAKDKEGTVCARILSSSKAAAGMNRIYWGGYGTDTRYLATGEYYISVSATGAGGTVTYPVQKLNYIGTEGSSKPRVQGDISIFSLLTTPTQTESANAKYLLRTKNGGTLTVVVASATGKRTAYKGTVKAGYSIISIPKSYLLESKYTMTASLTINGKKSGEGTTYRSITPEIVEVTGNDAFDVGILEWFTGSVKTISTGKLYVKVYNDSNKLVKSIYSAKKMSSTATSISWSGFDDAGNRVPAGIYTVKVYYEDEFGASSQTVTKKVKVTRKQYPSGVYDYVYIGNGTYKTKIQLYSNTSGAKLDFTYAQSAIFEPIQNLGTYWYVKANMPTGKPLYCYVKASSLMKLAIRTDYRIEISRDCVGPWATRQMFYLYKGDTLLKSFHISTGKPLDATPLGHYVILNRLPYFMNSGARCEHALRIVGGVCIHRVPLIDGSYELTTSRLGKPASHGCIRVPIEESEYLYTTIPDTTPVYIYE